MNQKGIAQLFLVFLLLVGIVIGLYLVQNPAIFKPKASEGTPLNPAVKVGMTYTHTDFSSCDLAGGGTNNGFANTGLLVSYDKPGVRDRVKQSLGSMKSSGIQSLDLVVWFMHDPSGGTWGIIPSSNKKVDEPYRTNLANYLKDVKDSGFQRIMITLGPQWTNSPGGYEGNGKYDPNLFDENWQFLKDVRSIVKQNGPAGAYFDILGEGAPPNPAEVRKAQMSNYDKQLWTNYVREFGKEDAVISFISPNPVHPDDSLKDDYSDLWDSGAIDNLFDIFQSSGQGQPNWYQFSFYPNRPTYERSLHILNYIDQKLTARGYGGNLIIREGWYNNTETARAIAEFNNTHSRKITEALAWYLKYYEGYGDPNVDKLYCPVNTPYDLTEFISHLSRYRGFITASPNPCILNSSGVCTSAISWNFGGNSDVKISVRENTGSVFAQAPSGSQEAPWITANGATFDAYVNNSLVDSLSVRGVKASPAPDSSQASATIGNSTLNPQPAAMRYPDSAHGPGPDSLLFPANPPSAINSLPSAGRPTLTPSNQPQNSINPNLSFPLSYICRIEGLRKAFGSFLNCFGN